MCLAIPRMQLPAVWQSLEASPHLQTLSLCPQLWPGRGGCFSRLISSRKQSCSLPRTGASATESGFPGTSAFSFFPWVSRVEVGQ